MKASTMHVSKKHSIQASNTPFAAGAGRVEFSTEKLITSSYVRTYNKCPPKTDYDLSVRPSVSPITDSSAPSCIE